jgi:uroporphyrinogen-III synthase
MARVGILVAELAHLRVVAIGPATRKAIEQRGLKVDVVPKEYVAEAIVSMLRDQVRGQNVLLLRAKVARDVIPNQLRKVAARVDVIEAYETVLPESSREQLLDVLRRPGRRPDVITFTSSSTARNFRDLLGAEAAYSGLLDGIKLASIGPITTATLEELKLPAAFQAKEYTIPGLVEAIVRHLKE